MSTSVQQIQAILSYQKTAGKPPQQVCNVIAALKDLCELNGVSVDWRRGGTASTNHPSSPNTRPMFKNNSSSSLAASPSAFPRTVSAKSFGSSSTSESPNGASSPIQKAPMPSSSGRYQSQFKNSSQPVNDKILNNIILSKLNKFSSSTYNDIREFLYQILGSGEPDLAEMIRQFMLLVFKKAASEEVYCSLYAKLLSEISVRYGVILEEMHKLQENYLSIFEEVEEKEADEKYETFVEKNIEKRYRQGYSQFIAELSSFEIIQLSHLEQTFRRIFDIMLKNATVPDKKTLLEEYADCLARMSRVFKKKSSPFLIAARASLTSLCKTPIETLLVKNPVNVSVSSKVRFILMDVKDNLSA
jgi:hypothetical protein